MNKLIASCLLLLQSRLKKQAFQHLSIEKEKVAKLLVRYFKNPNDNFTEEEKQVAIPPKKAGISTN